MFIFPTVPFLIIVEVAPLRTHIPWVTTTRTSFGASVSSVSLLFEGLVFMPANVPSAACGKSIPFAIIAPQVEAFNYTPKPPPLIA